MESLQVPRPAWMTEDLNMLRDQTRKFLASELVPHLEEWHDKGIMDRSAWTKLGEAGLLCAAIPEEYGGAGGTFAHETIIMIPDSSRPPNVHRRWIIHWNTSSAAHATMPA